MSDAKNEKFIDNESGQKVSFVRFLDFDYTYFSIGRLFIAKKSNGEEYEVVSIDYKRYNENQLNGKGFYIVQDVYRWAAEHSVECQFCNETCVMEGANLPASFKHRLRKISATGGSGEYPASLSMGLYYCTNCKIVRVL